jgi:hypothetical protein
MKVMLGLLCVRPIASGRGGRKALHQARLMVKASVGVYAKLVETGLRYADHTAALHDRSSRRMRKW